MSGVRELTALLAPWASPPAPVPLTGVALDSRALRPGSLFLAVPGGARHGAEFLDPALAAGAAAVAYEPAPGLDAAALEARCAAAGVPAVAVSGLGAAAGAIAARFHGEPSQALTVIGVTGTDGKTSVSHYTAQLLDGVVGRCGLVGTLGHGFAGALEAGSLTTPDATRLQAALAELRDQGARAVVMEVSSHALAQARVDAVAFDVAVLTNLGRDHLDYHGTLAAYAEAKSRLFAWAGLRARVLNLDDALGARLATGHEGVIGYGEAEGAALRLEAVTARETGLAVSARVGGRRLDFELPLLGRFNAWNALAAVGVLLALGGDPEAARPALARLRPVPGRMERFGGGDRPLAVVDYAHTPGALEAALIAVRRHCTGRLWCVFGCGGERDTGKRPLMGGVASRLAHQVVLTSDNPRGEDPRAILEDIRQGCDGPAEVAVEPDREAAIARALGQAAPGDVVLVAGKGHEDYQIVGERRLAFSDRATVRTLLAGEVV
ncbi:UDP-N-acetylmuramoyl-L-alanyl-D-glutamate--2,6-diaminopimelate ligase [Sediminicurvatus halobius]|uniref:UDP-N-acetylmuramoyl-L-alanyl-D-glutamate--2,6-diaminopimelate ligase n=1 Tax=Sediminicurvatus halobius TaxID=2182432 RepID=A0A2U2N881_9GAMM|nr:UDP-N-acetylmuramoyl-L-alanyl-D-glutamate--2,6-diaminopimelate ligase [Spiribacter halobius]PWG65179.1 UDP-N-acetylmuramoyl-L-alanyl-D-glutamate--2,6-diaminopimelate ligase [Spiribacter halobius]UEX78869.1 UDP-N-acetylmuramoyl-L-alanyl-D-glutamate--2,6-diaminopimelate ligase [Spiribacter halobius]